MLSTVFVCFFFQAEDGIRDLTVTGVQTCALSDLRPIAKKMRGCPYWNTSSTADMETIAPSATIHPTVVKPALFRALASGSATPSSVYGTIPVRTAPTIM